MLPVASKGNVSANAIVLANLKKEHANLLSRINSIAHEMRETIGLDSEFVEARLKEIESLLEIAPENRDPVVAQNNLHARFKQIKEENLETYQNLLDAREGIIKFGRTIPLTVENKEQLMLTFALLIDEKILQNNFPKDFISHLEELRGKTKHELEIKLYAYENLLSLKTDLTTKLQDRESQYIEIKTVNEQNAMTIQNIWQACEQGNIEYIKEKIDGLFLFKVSDFVNQQDEQGQTGLSLAVAHGHFDCAQYLLAKGANPNSADKLGYQPLHWAAKKGDLEMTHLLLDNQADINAQGEYNRIPLHMAAYNGKHELVDFFIQKGTLVNAQVTCGGCSALHKAVMQEYLLVVCELVKCSQLDVNIRDDRNHTPLYYAIQLGCSDMAAFIVSHPSWQKITDPNDPNHFSQLRKLKPQKNTIQIQKFLDFYE